MHSSKNNSSSIVWMIDPFEPGIANRAPLAQALKVFSRDLSQKIRPFSVVSPGGSTWAIPVSFPLGKELQELGAKSVARDLKKLQMKGMAPPTVEVHESSSRKEVVDDVLRFAKEQNASCIAVNTRRLFSSSPFRLGTFAEVLMRKSTLPVLAVNPNAKVSSRVKRILFPTDFERGSRQAFQKALRLADRFGAELQVLHVELPLPVPFSYCELALGVDQAFMKEAEEARHRRLRRSAKQWEELAQRAGVKCSFSCVRGVGPVAPYILKAASRDRADLIIMAGYRSATAAAVLGGTIRDVLASALTPVLEIRG